MNYYDNPFFPEVLRCEMEWDKAHDTDKYYHIWEGQCVRHSEAQIFYGKWRIDNFETPENASFYSGFDFGFANDPNACIRCWIRDMILYVDHESFGVKVDIDNIPNMLDSIPLIRKLKIVGDSSRPETISMLKKYGFYVVGAEKGKGSVEDGITKIRGFREIIIHERCKHIADEFRNYCWKVDPLTGEVMRPPKPEDKHNHGIDALRYALEDVNMQSAREMWNRFQI
jgi:phage terminase large subunit